MYANICEWFVENNLPIYLGGDKTKCLLSIAEKTAGA